MAQIKSGSNGDQIANAIPHLKGLSQNTPTLPPWSNNTTAPTPANDSEISKAIDALVAAEANILRDLKAYATAIQSEAGVASPKSLENQKACRIFVANLPKNHSKEGLRNLFHQALSQVRPGYPVQDVVKEIYLNNTKRLAFVEFTTTEECQAAVRLDGLVYNDKVLRLRKPENTNNLFYNPYGIQKTFPLDMDQLDCVSTQDAGGNKLYCSGFPPHFTEVDIKKLLSLFGKLQYLYAVKVSNRTQILQNNVNKDTVDSQIEEKCGEGPLSCFFKYAKSVLVSDALVSLNKFKFPTCSAKLTARWVMVLPSV